MTAIEWLIKEYFGDIENCSPNFRNKIQQAKEMEKQQIIESYCQGCYDITKDDSIFPREKSEQYYNETFNK